MSLENVLSAGLAALGLECSDEHRQKLLDYVGLLAKWNRVYNLTAVRKPTDMVTRHLLDSLVVLPYLRGERVLDVGTGAGLPGIPLAIMNPEREFVLLDSNSKKTRFVQQAIVELALDNVQVVHARVEDYRPERSFDVVISRAFATVADMLAGAGHHCAVGGAILAMKGANPAAELQDIGPGYTLERVVALTVPGLDEARHLACLTPDADAADH
jgi:16S rRNA (guanine527-N7)-methyltransferase